MPWCPKCKNEYREGIKVCSDCGCELITEAKAGKKAITFGTEEEMEELAAFLKYSRVEGAEVSYGEEENVCELYVPEEQKEEAAKLVLVFRQQKELERLSQPENDEELKKLVEEAKSYVKPSALYEKSADKAQENKSSAYMLLLFGVVGIIVVILGIAGVLPIRLGGTSMYLTYGIMSALFILFIVMGVLSMKSYRIFAQKAESENSLRNTIEAWCHDNLEPEALDEELFQSNSEIPEEEKYFKRASLIKEKISMQFMNLDEAFLDNFVDEIYEDIFEEE